MVSGVDNPFEEQPAFELETIKVTAPSGAEFAVMTDSEKDYFNSIASQYTKDNHFTNISDMQDLDRVLVWETICWRWSLWLSQEKDYWGQDLDLDLIRKSLNDYSKELRLLKKSLGIDKSTRDKDKGEATAAYIHTLGIRAKEFGVRRNKQAVKAITLFQELKALITFHENCTPEERKENHVEEHDVIEWIKSVIPEFDEIDEKFRSESQTYWVREM